MRKHWFVWTPILVIAGAGLWFLFRKPPTVQLHGGKPIPTAGLKMFEENWDKPGNPEHAITDLKKMYWVIDQFRRKNNRLPELREILSDALRSDNPNMLGLEDQTTPDGHLKDGHTPGATNDTYFYAFRTKRPDGNARPAFPKSGEKDVWVYTDAYVRRRQTVYQDHRSTFQPSGVYVVLWSDGTIEKVPMPEMLKYRVSDTEWRYTFRGQAGVPKDAVSWADS